MLDGYPLEITLTAANSAAQAWYGYDQGIVAGLLVSEHFLNVGVSPLSVSFHPNGSVGISSNSKAQHRRHLHQQLFGILNRPSVSAVPTDKISARQPSRMSPRCTLWRPSRTPSDTLGWRLYQFDRCRSAILFNNLPTTHGRPHHQWLW